METYTMADACPQPAAPQSVPTMTFGKHNGKPISDVPMSYVMWLLVDKSTDNTSKRGNYDWIKANAHRFDPPTTGACMHRPHPLLGVRLFVWWFCETGRAPRVPSGSLSLIGTAYDAKDFPSTPCSGPRTGYE